MPKYLAQATFSNDGLKGLKAAGAASRLEAGRALMASLGGVMESYHFAFGDVDAIIIMELPDDEAAAAASIAANLGGGATVKMTKLLTVEQLDESLARTIDFRPPGA